MKRFKDPLDCWQQFKLRYKIDNNPRKVFMIDKFFSTKNLSTMNMDEYLMAIKETANI